MLNICAGLAVAILIVFTMFNLFLPYALIALAAIVPLGFACGVISRARGRNCKMGICGI